MLVPTTNGSPISCPPAQGVAPAPCVGFEGAAAYPVFFLESTGFDVPPDYVGVDGKPVGHLTIEARRQSDAPAIPCVGGTRLANVKVAQWTAEQYRCPSDSAIVEREAMHGEGAYVGHLLFTWNEGGNDYVASLHGHTTTNRELLRKIVASMALIAPGS